MTPRAVVAHFDARFRELGTPARAAGAKAYMKSALRFHGVDAAQLRAECASFCARPPALTRARLVSYADACSGVTWREAIKYLPPAMTRAVTARRRAAA